MESLISNHCKNCGAELEATNDATLKCNFCGSFYSNPNSTNQVVQNTEINEISDSDLGQDADLDNESTNEISSVRPQYEDQLSGQLPDDSNWRLPPPSPMALKLKLYRNTALVFLLLWVGLYFFRLNMPDGKTNLSEHHDIVFSPIGGDYWWVRCVLFVVVFPFLSTLLIYNLRYRENGK